MYLPSDSRIITVGDGDLSFSRALLTHIAPENLLATTYDSEMALREKYQRHALDDLINAGVNVVHSLDITAPDSAEKLKHHRAAIII